MLFLYAGTCMLNTSLGTIHIYVEAPVDSMKGAYALTVLDAKPGRRYYGDA